MHIFVITIAKTRLQIKLAYEFQRLDRPLCMIFILQKVLNISFE